MPPFRLSWPSAVAGDPATSLTAQRRARNRSLVRDGIILLLAVIALIVTSAVSEIPNEHRAAALELVPVFEDTFRAVRSGELTLDTEPAAVAPGVDGVRLERGDADRWVLTGAAGGDCYAMWWGTEGLRRTRTLASDMACEPSALATSPRPEHFDEIGRVVPESAEAASWDLVLPAPTRHRTWFLPAVIIGGGVGLSALVRISIALLTGKAPAHVRE